MSSAYSKTRYESQVISAMMFDPALAITRAQAILNAKDFTDEKNRWLFTRITKLYEDAVPIDLTTICDADGCDAHYAAALYAEASTGHNVDYHAKQVKEASIRRSMSFVGSQLAETSGDENIETVKILAALEKKMGQLSTPDVKADGMSQIMGDYMDTLGNKADSGYKTGFRDLDNILVGLRPGKVSVLAARPGCGKSSLMLDIARYNAGNAKIGIISLEMDTDEICGRLLSQAGRIDQTHVQHHNLTPNDWAAASSSMPKIPVHNMVVSDTCDGLQDVKAAISKWASEGIKVVFIDYLQLIEAEGENRNQAVSFISRQLKKLSVRLSIHIMALSQLNRQVEGRGDRIPKLSDLRESGAIEQDADIVMLMWRGEENGRETDEAHIHVAKHRGGPKGYADLTFVGAYTTFTEWKEVAI